MPTMAPQKKYCKWFWDESLGGDFDTWGTSTYFIELTLVGNDLCATRQIEVYENGNVLFYDEDHLADNYGMLCDKPLDSKDLQEFGITQAEFEQIWNTKTPMNR
ncbi:hypothetical protein [Nostoc sp. CMAA1605]|uniref:hypothetical protein n=1 Tax=Nostoc sp. CMAA1605 TaxID=2055159 RepID=UPI001F3EC857|nr:hypothetical protein [Nostoc sp. CMAA1605]MCF4968555.1 hypothetical protein [Nostoc sp. CMAA1605]